MFCLSSHLHTYSMDLLLPYLHSQLRHHPCTNHTTPSSTQYLPVHRVLQYAPSSTKTIKCVRITLTPVHLPIIPYPQTTSTYVSQEYISTLSVYFRIMNVVPGRIHRLRNKMDIIEDTAKPIHPHSVQHPPTPNDHMSREYLTPLSACFKMPDMVWGRIDRAHVRMNVDEEIVEPVHSRGILHPRYRVDM